MELPENFKSIHALTAVYLGFAMFTDGDLAEEEIGTISAKISEWDPDLNADELADVVGGVGAWLGSADDDQEIIEMLQVLLNTLSSEASPFKGREQSIVSDLVQISMADGQIHPNEEKFVREYAKEVGAAVPPKFRATI